MERLQCVGDPSSLVLAWQAPDRVGDRFRWAVATLRKIDGDCSLTYLNDDGEFGDLNQGRPYAQLLDCGYRGYPGFSPKIGCHEVGVMAALMRRLPPRSRPDFDAYLRHFGLETGLSISDFALLGLTEAKLPNDGFSVVDTFDGYQPPLDLITEVAGYRYYAANINAKIRLGAQVEIVAEPENQYDRNAIQFRIGGQKLGNVNRLQTKAYHQWIASHSLRAAVQRINGTADKPKLYIFIRVREAKIS